jgi:hypothetical protein
MRPQKTTGAAALLLALACTLAPLIGLGQSPCPSATVIQAAHLIGQWQVTLHSPTPEQWTLDLQAHPEHTGSLKGSLVQGNRRALVVADWDDGEFTMEESLDGQRIAATWQGQATEGQCGRQIEGTRMQGEPSPPTRFTMRSSSLP